MLQYVFCKYNHSGNVIIACFCLKTLLKFQQHSGVSITLLPLNRQFPPLLHLQTAVFTPAVKLYFTSLINPQSHLHHFSESRCVKLLIQRDEPLHVSGLPVRLAN